MELCPNPGSGDRCSAYPGMNGSPTGLSGPDEFLCVHWSGFGCSQDRSVAELQAYYVPRLDAWEG